MFICALGLEDRQRFEVSLQREYEMYLYRKRALTLEAVLERLEHADTFKQENIHMNVEKASLTEQKQKCELVENSVSPKILTTKFTIRGYVSQMKDRDGSISFPVSPKQSTTMSKNIGIFLPISCSPSCVVPSDIGSPRAAIATYEEASILKNFVTDIQLNLDSRAKTMTGTGLETGGHINVEGNCPSAFSVDRGKCFDDHSVIGIGSEFTSIDELMRVKDSDLLLNFKKAIPFEQEHSAAMDSSGNSCWTGMIHKVECLQCLKGVDLLQSSQQASQGRQSSKLPPFIKELDRGNFLCSNNSRERDKDSLDGHSFIGQNECPKPNENSKGEFEGSTEFLCKEVTRHDAVQPVQGASPPQMTTTCDRFHSVVSCPKFLPLKNCDFTFNLKEVKNSELCPSISLCQGIAKSVKLKSQKVKARKTRLLSEIIQCPPLMQVGGSATNLQRCSLQGQSALTVLETLADRSCTESHVSHVTYSDTENLPTHVMNYKSTSTAETPGMQSQEPLCFQVHDYCRSRNKEAATTHVSRRLRSKRKHNCNSMSRSAKGLFSMKSTTFRPRPGSELKKVHINHSRGRDFELYLSDSSSCGEYENNESHSESRNYRHTIFEDCPKGVTSHLDQSNSMWSQMSFDLRTSTADNLRSSLNKAKSLNHLDDEFGRYKKLCLVQGKIGENKVISEISKADTSISQGDTQYGQQGDGTSCQGCKNQEREGPKVVSGSLISSYSEFKSQKSLRQHKNRLLLDDAWGMHSEQLGSSATSGGISFGLGNDSVFSSIGNTEPPYYSSMILLNAPDEDTVGAVGNVDKADVAVSDDQWCSSLNLPSVESFDAKKTRNERAMTRPLHDTFGRNQSKLLSIDKCTMNRADSEAVETLDFSAIESPEVFHMYVKPSYVSTTNNEEIKQQCLSGIEPLQKKRKLESTNDCERLSKEFSPSLSAGDASRTNDMSEIVDPSHSLGDSIVTATCQATQEDPEAIARRSILQSSPRIQIPFRRLKEVARKSSQRKIYTSFQGCQSAMADRDEQLARTYLEKLLMNALSEQSSGDGSMQSHPVLQNGLPPGDYSFVRQTIYPETALKWSLHLHQATTSTEVPLINNSKRSSFIKEMYAQHQIEGPSISLAENSVSDSLCRSSQTYQQSCANLACSLVFDPQIASDLTQKTPSLQERLIGALSSHGISIPETAIPSHDLSLIASRTDDHACSLAFPSARTCKAKISRIQQSKSQSCVTDGRNLAHSLHEPVTSRNGLLPSRMIIGNTLVSKGSVVDLKHMPRDKSFVLSPNEQRNGSGCKNSCKGSSASSQWPVVLLGSPESIFSPSSIPVPFLDVNGKPRHSFSASRPPETLNRYNTSSIEQTQLDVQRSMIGEQKTAAQTLLAPVTTSVGHVRHHDLHGIHRTGNSANHMSISDQVLPVTVTSGIQSVERWSMGMERPSDGPQSGLGYTMFKPSIIRKRKASFVPSFLSVKNSTT